MAKGKIGSETNKERMELAARLKILMDKSGVREFSRKTSVNHVTMGRYIDGESDPTVEVIRNIAKSMDVSFDWLISGKGPMSLKDAESVKDILEPKKLKNTFCSLEAVSNAINFFESKVRQKGKTYRPEQIASSILMLCIISESSIDEQDSKEIIKLVRAL